MKPSLRVAAVVVAGTAWLGWHAFHSGTDRHGVSGATARAPTAADRSPHVDAAPSPDGGQRAAVPAESRVDEGPDGAAALLAMLDQGDLDAEQLESLMPMQKRFIDRATSDPGFRNALMVRIRANASNRNAVFAVSVLEQVASPDVREFGIEMASSADRSQLMAGLGILGLQGRGDERILPLAREAARRNVGDPEVVVAALSAMQVAPESEFAASGVMNTMLEYAYHPDSAVRSASLFGVAQFARRGEDLGVMVEALQSQDPSDRVSAAMALEEGSIDTPGLDAVLTSRVSDSQEVWEVRAMAANRLEQMQPTGSQQAALQQFRDEQRLVAAGW